MKIAVLDDYQGVALEFADWSVLPRDCEVTVFRDTLADQDALVERLLPFEIVCAMRERTPFPASLLVRLPNLRLIATTGMKNAAIDVAAARARGILVCGTQSSPYAAAELAFGLILALARGLETETRSMREGGWQTGIGRDLHGATLGVIGLGRLGTRVAAMGQAFGMKVVAWSQNLTEERCHAAGVAFAPSKETLLESADFATVHLRLSERTRGLIGAAEFARMKPDAYFVNTSRGPIVDWRALIKAVEAGRPAGAALDVYDEEPLPADHPLRRCRKILLTPHVGYVTRETYRIFYGETVENIRAFLEGRPLRVIEA